jgi:hypothetical protein
MMHDIYSVFSLLNTGYDQMCMNLDFPEAQVGYEALDSEAVMWLQTPPD